MNDMAHIKLVDGGHGKGVLFINGKSVTTTSIIYSKAVDGLDTVTLTLPVDSMRIVGEESGEALTHQENQS